MKTKFCLDCGISLEESQDICPCCGLEGQNRVFATKDDYLRWEKTVLLPRKQASLIPTQVFAGDNHALILRSNGELYAIGNNYNGCCGEDQRAELMQFTCIARGVVHAAASQNHTIYVSRNGKVTLLGRSEYVDRFRCDFPVRRVYANPSRDAFWLEDMQGRFYFFGERKVEQKNIREEYILLRKLPRLTVREKQTDSWGYHHVEYHSKCSRYKQESSVISGSFTPGENPEVQEALRSDWFRALVQEYGEGNVGIWLGNEVKTEQVSHRTIPNGTDHSDYEDVYDHQFDPEVFYMNNFIYTPTPCIRNDDVLKDNHFSGCWPESPIYSDPEDKRIAKCCMFFHGISNDQILAVLDDKGSLTFHHKYTTYNPDWCLKDVADLAVSPYHSNAYCKDLILAVTKTGEVYMGKRDAVEEAARGEKERFYLFRKRPDPWNLLTKVDF